MLAVFLVLLVPWAGIPAFACPGAALDPTTTAFLGPRRCW